jgi:hypothetical protein
LGSPYFFCIDRRGFEHRRPHCDFGPALAGSQMAGIICSGMGLLHDSGRKYRRF